MPNYDKLKVYIQNSIKSNGNREITGFTLQDVLLRIVDELGEGTQPGSGTIKLSDLADININEPQTGQSLIYSEQSKTWFNSAESDKNYIHTQNTPLKEWMITHNLGKYPAVSVIDSAGTEVEGEVQYIDLNNVRLIFSAEFSGKATLN